MFTNVSRPSLCWGFDRRAVTATTTVTSTDRGYTIDCTSGTYDVALDAAATLGAGFPFVVYNSGSGTITVNPNASETLRTPSGTVTTIALTQGQGLFVLCDGANFEVVGAVGLYGGSTISGLTADRVVFAASATTISTPVTIKASNLIDWATPVAVTGGTTITSSGVGKVHLCTGTSADYTVTLPDSGMTAGDLIAFQMGDTTTLTKRITLDATSGNLIDGVQTRVMWSNEVAIIKWDGTNWCKVGGKSVAMSAAISRSSAQTIVTTTFVKIQLNTQDYNNGMTTDVATNYRITLPRPGLYTCRAYSNWDLASVTEATILVYKNGSYIALNNDNSTASVYRNVFVVDLPVLAAGDYIEAYVSHVTGADRNIGLGKLSVTEMAPW